LLGCLFDPLNPCLRELVHVLPALSLPESAAEAYGSIRAELEARREMIGNNDLWIAAHAVVAGLTLVTNNESECRRVRGLRTGLSREPP
jgi:tRNA(fMet)-specific endonuclease VapC